MTKNKKPDLILHIGSEKTGSTSIQKFLRHNQKKLEEINFFVPQIFGDLNQELFPLLFYGDNKNDELLIRKGFVDNNDSFIYYKKDLYKSFTRLINLKNNYSWIISSEFISSRLTEEKEIEKLSTELKKTFNKLKIILYIRDPLTFYISFISEQIKRGHEINNEYFSDENFEKYKHILNYKKLLKLWNNFFTEEQFEVRRFYGKNEKNDFNVIEDFKACLGIKNPKDYKNDFFINDSLSDYALRCLSQINKSFPSSYGEINNSYRYNLEHYFRLPTKQYGKKIVSNDEYKLINNYFEETKNYLEENYPNIPIFKLGKNLNKEKEYNSTNKYHKELSDHEISLLEIIQDIYFDLRKSNCKRNKLNEDISNLIKKREEFILEKDGLNQKINLLKNEKNKGQKTIKELILKNQSNQIKISKGWNIIKELRLKNQSNQIKISKAWNIIKELRLKKQSNQIKISKDQKIIKELRLKNQSNQIKISKDQKIIKELKLKNQSNQIKISKDQKIIKE